MCCKWPAQAPAAQPPPAAVGASCTGSTGHWLEHRCQREHPFHCHQRYGSYAESPRARSRHVRIPTGSALPAAPVQSVQLNDRSGSDLSSFRLELQLPPKAAPFPPGLRQAELGSPAWPSLFEQESARSSRCRSSSRYLHDGPGAPACIRAPICALRPQQRWLRHQQGPAAPGGRPMQPPDPPGTACARPARPSPLLTPTLYELQAGKVVILLSGRYAGKKAVIVKVLPLAGRGAGAAAAARRGAAAAASAGSADVDRPAARGPGALRT